MEFVAYAGQFKKYVQAVAKISEEARQTVTTDGLVCSAVDMACACMVQAQMDSDIVDFSDEPGTEVGLDMTVLSSICKTVTGSAEVGWTQPNGQIHIRSGRSVHVMSPLPLASLRPIPVPQGWSAQVKVAISGASLREAVLSGFNPCFSGTRARTRFDSETARLWAEFQSLFFWNSRPDK